jgi:hypothetical protein
MASESKRHRQENSKPFFLTKDDEFVTYSDGLRLYGPFFITLCHHNGSQIISSIGQEDIADQTKLICAYAPALKGNNEDFKDVLGFFKQRSFF